MSKAPSYKRALLKISGEALLGKKEVGVDFDALHRVGGLIHDFYKSGHEIGIVIGGGNIFRGFQGSSHLKMERTSADQMGMLATIINGIALKEALIKLGIPVLLMSALECLAVAERYNWEKASQALASGTIVIFVGGTGHPYFTTDTAAALRASEIKADIFLKATTRVDGIYDQDPLLHPEAKKFDTLSYREIVEKKLGVIDLTAATLCMTNHIPIRVFNLFAGPLLNAVSDKPYGTLVR